jgi:hypothetical protein
MSPAAKRVWQQKMAVWQANTTASFQVSADRLGVAARKGDMHALMDKAAQVGDDSLVPVIEDHMARAVNVGDYTPEEASDELRQFKTRLSVGQVSNLIEAKPQRAKELLADPKKWPEIPEATRNRLVTQASTQERTNLGLLPVNPLTGQIDDKVLDDAVAAGQVNRDQANRQKLTQKRESNAEDNRWKQTIMAGVHEQQRWEGASNPDEYANELAEDLPNIRDQATQHDVRDAINKELASVKKTGQTSDHPVLRDELEQLRREDVAGMRSREVLGRRNLKFQITDDDLRGMGVDPKDRVNYSEAQKLIAADHENKLREWFTNYQQAHGGKSPSPQELSDERIRILKPATEAAVKASFGGFKVGNTYTDAKGNKATWDGDKWVEIK